jgi:BirA family biotin operon repressor/biotin-[acetyl-CoA-carboxylase] ligase
MRHASHTPTAASDPVPDVLDAAFLSRLLTTAIFGRCLHVLSDTSSTNDEVKRLAAQGAPEGTVVVAEYQSKGRGRQGRTFVSPAGVGIYLSVLLRPSIATTQLPQLTFLVAVAAAEALSEVTALPIGLKWPNDVEVQGKKVAGILTEAIFCPGAPPAVVVGIGVNVNTRLQQLPSELHHRVTSLALEAGRPFPRPQLIIALLAHLERLYHTFQQYGISPILKRWLHYGRIVGRHVRFAHGATYEEGRVLGLDADGALLVHMGNGMTQRVISGEVTFL